MIDRRVAIGFALAISLIGCGPAIQDPTTRSGEPTGAPSSAGSTGVRIALGGSEALAWGSGPQGVVLVHGAAYDAASWTRQAAEFANAGIAVLAVEDTSTESLLAAIDYLRSDLGSREVTLLGASAGGASVIAAAAANPDRYEQLILLSPAGGDTSSLSDGPKFFIYSADEGGAGSLESQIAGAPGQDNQVLEVEGSAHAQAIFDSDAGADVVAAIIERIIS